MSKMTTRSIWFVSCVAIGLLLAYIDDISMAAILKTGLLFSAGFVVFLVAEAIWMKHRNR